MSFLKADLQTDKVGATLKKSRPEIFLLCNGCLKLSRFLCSIFYYDESAYLSSIAWPSERGRKPSLLLRFPIHESEALHPWNETTAIGRRYGFPGSRNDVRKIRTTSLSRIV
jgi:hypothetical protein